MRKLNLISLAVAAALAAPLAHADAGDTTLGGVMFVDFTSVNNQNNGTDVDPNGIGLDVKRAYLIFGHQFDDVWSVNVTTDFNFPKLSVTGTGTDSTGAPVSVSSSGNAPETQVFIKKAYVQGKFSDMTVLRLGASDMPWIPYAEGIYGYRFVENTLIDRSEIGGIGSFGNSSDWGVNLSGGSGVFGYSAALVNGGGYKNPTRSKTMDFEGRVNFMPVDGLNIAVGYYTGELGQDTEANETANAAVSKNTATRTDALIAWKASGLTAGLEYFTADDFGSKLIFTNTEDKADGYSVFASYDFPDTQWGVFGRYDNVKPRKDTNSSLQDKYYNVGVSLKSNKNITWAFAWKNEKLTDDATTDLKFDEFGVWAQIKF
ncbi:MAG TPA: carbohydrate porin [Gammaproteobacteria bacterium]|jgi:hypothetical protein|nr:carbohydrate porin [Gammaproteobacteria bacterium]